MEFDQSDLDELNLLLQYDLSSLSRGIKVHSNAKPATISAAQRLYDKKLCTNSDGGFLTDQGIEIAQQLNTIFNVLKK